jgi:hypothetical protein
MDAAGIGGEGGIRIKYSPTIFSAQFHSPRHLFPQLILRRSNIKSFYINLLGLYEKTANPQALEKIPRFGRKKPDHSALAPSRFLAKSTRMLGNFAAHPGLRACLRQACWRRKGDRKDESL